MKNIQKLSILFLLPVVLISCAKNNGGNNNSDSSKEEYDFEQPVEGNEASETSVTLKDGTKATLRMNMSQEESLPIIRKLRSFDGGNTNWDGHMELFSLSEDVTFNVQAKSRYTNTSDKHGYYLRTESGSYVIQEASTSAAALNHCSFGYATEKDEMISFYANIPSPSTVEYVNSMEGSTILYEDPDYEWGSYYKDNLPIDTSKIEDPSTALTGCVRYKKIIKGFPCFELTTLLSSVKIGDNPTIEPNVSYKITDKYLVIDIEKPYGLVQSYYTGQDANIIYNAATNSSMAYYLNAKIYYDINSGNVAFCNASFKTIQLLSEYLAHPFEGTITMKTQIDSDEGYERYMKIRQEVMSQYTRHTK